MDLPLVGVNYSEAAPFGYSCDECRSEGVKLWRAYQTVLEGQRFLCASCAIRDQKQEGIVRDDGKFSSGDGWADSIGWMVPAVPTVEGDTFWGYSSIPQDGVDWWRRLPLSPSPPQPTKGPTHD